MDTPSKAGPGHWLKPIHVWFVAIVLVGAAITGAFLSPVSANADYICTKVVTTGGGCTSGSWGAWQTTSQSTSGGVTTTTKQRTYTGTRAVSATLSYLNLRTQCQSGYTQQSNGQAGGGSGFHGGGVTTQYSACQITETQTNSSGTSGSSVIQMKQQDTGQQSTDSRAVSSLGELDAAGQNAGGGGGPELVNASAAIVAKPSLVRNGESTVVSWNAEGVTTCTVTGSNGDVWSNLINGSRSSAPLLAQTTYRLVCPLKSGSSLEAFTVVNIIPQFQEQ